MSQNFFLLTTSLIIIREVFIKPESTSIKIGSNRSQPKSGRDIIPNCICQMVCCIIIIKSMSFTICIEKKIISAQ